MIQTNKKKFQTNCEKWSATNPKEAVLLPYLECDAIQFCQTKQGELNLKNTEKPSFHYHSNTNAAHESEQWFQEFLGTSTQIIYVYGVGLGYYYLAAKKWLKSNPERQLVFFEDDLRVIHRLFETDLGSEILNNHQVHLHFINDFEEWKQVSEIVWNFSVLSHLQVSALKPYAKHKEELYKELAHQICYDEALFDAYLNEYFSYGLVYFRNFYANILKLHQSKLGSELFGKFKDVPAILVGAGPSLQKNIELLGQLKNKAIIFGGGSAVNVLKKDNIEPHFGCGVDPNSAQFERLNQHQVLDIPFFYRNRMYFEAFNLLRGPKLYITGSGGYQITEWFEEQLGIKSEDLDEGHNVINFCLEIATAMGCNPIIFAGMDLAYTDMQAYAKGVVKKSKVSKSSLNFDSDINSVAVLREDINGQPVYTLWKWISESRWISDFAKSHPEKTLVNATEGGIGFEGIENLSLDDVVKKYFTKKFDVTNLLNKEIDKANMPQVTLEKIVYLMNELSSSLERCIGFLNDLIDDYTTISKWIEDNRQIPHSLQSGLGALAEIELSQEVAYNYILEAFNIVFSRAFNFELLQLKRRRLSEWKKAYIKQQFSIKKLLFLKNTAQVNLEIIKHVMHEETNEKLL